MSVAAHATTTLELRARGPDDPGTVALLDLHLGGCGPRMVRSGRRAERLTEAFGELLSTAEVWVVAPPLL